jgi:Arc/MetJ-type ribon-helix-helix transcriptional regulator
MKSVNKRRRKIRGRPATGQDPVVPVRLPSELIKKIDAWGNKQHKPTQSRSEAIRSLVETGLARTVAAQAGRAQSADLAGQTIDRLADPAAAPEDRDKRKRRLLKGPEEFRDLREAPKPSRRTK